MKASTTEYDTWLHKLLFLAFFLLGMAAVLNAQVASGDIAHVQQVVTVDQNPTLTNWADVLKKLDYPDDCYDMGLQGEITFKLLLGEDGNVLEVDISTAVHPSFRKAIEAVMPHVQATPGMYKGKPIMTWYPVKVTFDLAEEKKRRKKAEKEAKKNN